MGRLKKTRDRGVRTRLTGRRARRLVGVAMAVALTAVAIPATASAQDGPAQRPAGAGPGVNDMLDGGFGHDMGRGQEATTRRSRPPAETEGSGGFLYRKGRFTPLATIPGSEFFQHHAINDRGEIAGYFVDEGTVLAPDGVPPEAVHGFVKDRGGRVTAFDVPGGSSPVPQGMNDRGDIAGIYLDRDLVQTGFLRDRKGKVTTIDLSPIGTKARDVNDGGEVVGIYGESADNELGYVVRGYLRNRNGSVGTIAIPGAGETSPYAIDDRSRVVGTYFDTGITLGPDGR